MNLVSQPLDHEPDSNANGNCLKIGKASPQCPGMSLTFLQVTANILPLSRCECPAKLETGNGLCSGEGHLKVRPRS